MAASWTAPSRWTCGRGPGDLGGQGQGGALCAGSVKKRQGGGAVAGSRRLWWGGAGRAAFLAAFELFFFDVVVDVPVVQIVDVTRLSSSPLLCKIGVRSRQCSPWSSTVAVLGQGGDMSVVATTGGVLGQGR